MAMNVNMVLSGDLERLVQDFIQKGYATSKAEVVRMGLLQLLQKRDFEDISDDPELFNYLLAVKEGRIRQKITGTLADLKKEIGARGQ